MVIAFVCILNIQANQQQSGSIYKLSSNIFLNCFPFLEKLANS